MEQEIRFADKDKLINSWLYMSDLGGLLYFGIGIVSKEGD